MVKKAREYEVTKRDEFPERLRRYPELQARMEALLDVVENASGDVVKADEAEERVVKEIRPMGQEALQAWAERKQRRVEAEYDRRRDVTRKEKKLYWHTRFGWIDGETADEASLLIVPLAHCALE
jgi:hypothetical protein